MDPPCWTRVLLGLTVRHIFPGLTASLQKARQNSISDSCKINETKVLVLPKPRMRGSSDAIISRIWKTSGGRREKIVLTNWNAWAVQPKTRAAKTYVRIEKSFLSYSIIPSLLQMQIKQLHMMQTRSIDGGMARDFSTALNREIFWCVQLSALHDIQITLRYVDVAMTDSQQDRERQPTQCVASQTDTNVVTPVI